MQLSSLGAVIATRDLSLDDSKIVHIAIGLPRAFPGSGAFYCPYQITGIGSERLRYAGGVDAVQALALTLQSIGTDLYTSAEFQAGRLRHLGQRNLGFPVVDAVAGLVPAD